MALSSTDHDRSPMMELYGRLPSFTHPMVQQQDPSRSSSRSSSTHPITPRHAHFLRSASRLQSARADRNGERGGADHDLAGTHQIYRNHILGRIPGDQANLARAFNKFDLSRTGQIDYESFRDAIKLSGLEQFNEDQILALFHIYDGDRKGFISVSDFMAGISDPVGSIEFANGSDRPHFPHVETAVPADQLQDVIKTKIGEKRASSHDLVDAFKLFSPNRNGIVTLPRFEDGLRLLGIQSTPDAVERLFREMILSNTDQTGIDFNTFVGRLLQQSYSSGDGFIGRLEAYVPRQARQGKLEIRDLSTHGSPSAVIDLLRDKIEQKASSLFAMRKALKTFDLDNSGEIDLAEFELALGNLGLNLSHKNVQDLFEQYSNGRSGISYNDFLNDVLSQGYKTENAIVHQLEHAFKIPVRRPRTAPVHRDPHRMDGATSLQIIVNAIGCRPRGLYNHLRAFKKFDRDSKGEIPRSSFIRRLRRYLGISRSILSTQEIVDAFNEVDTDQNGCLSHNEFQAMLGQGELAAVSLPLRSGQSRPQAPILGRCFSRTDIETQHLLIDKIKQKCIGLNELKRSINFTCAGKSEIGFGEFLAFCNRLDIGSTTNSVRRLFDKYKADSNSELIDYDRFIDLLMKDGYNPNDGLAGQFAERQLHRAKQPVLDVTSSYVNVDQILKEKFTCKAHGRQNLYRAFHKFDLDNSRSIDFDEFSRGCNQLGILLNAHDLKKVFQSYVPDGANHLNYHDFVDRILADQVSEGLELRCLRTQHAAKQRQDRIEKTKPKKLTDKELENGFDKDRLREQFDELYNHQQNRSVSFPEFVDNIGRTDHYLTAEESRKLFEKHSDGQKGSLQYATFLKRMMSENT